MKNLLLLCLLTLSLTTFATQKVIYGVDNRVDVFESTNNMFVHLSKSTAAMISKKLLRQRFDGAISILGYSLEGRGMCKTERFAKQLTAARCSGFLVGENLIATAGHCVEPQLIEDGDNDPTNDKYTNPCKETSWVFDYKVSHSDQFRMQTEKSLVYNCKKVIKKSLGYVNGSLDDWALVELDRDVADRDFLDIREKGQPKVGTDLVVIGHPTGLPTKIADQGKVTLLKKNYFHADLDTFGGNSGSAVFNSKTGVVEGILVRGAQDYVEDLSQGKCLASNVVSQGILNSEAVSNISRLSQLILDNRK